MADIAEAIAELIGSFGLDGVVWDADGTDGNVFIQVTPPTPDTAVTVRVVEQNAVETLGAEHEIDTSLQIVFRGKYTTPDVAVEVFNRLHFWFLDGAVLTVGGEQGESVRVIAAAVSGPVFMGSDAFDRPEWVGRLDVRWSGAVAGTAPSTFAWNGGLLLHGDVDPPVGVGGDGDFWLNTVTSVLFGPRTAGVWGVEGVSLVGPQGEPGEPGTDGDKGDPGDPATVGIVPVTITNAPITLNDTHNTIVATTTLTATLPPATGTGRTYRLISRTGTLTIQPPALNTIKQGGAVTLTPGEDLIVTDTSEGTWE